VWQQLAPKSSAEISLACSAEALLLGSPPCAAVFRSYQFLVPAAYVASILAYDGRLNLEKL
jgi:hypothetical protein